MAVKAVGLKAVRWLVWLLLFWLVVRGIFSFIPAENRLAQAKSESASEAAAEPPGLRAFPAIFTREYLTWDAANPQDHASRLQPFMGRDLQPLAGLGDGTRGKAQEVRETWVQRVDRLSATRWLVTVAARVSLLEPAVGTPGAATSTSTSGAKVTRERLITIGVPVSRSADGGWVVYDYPTLLPPPPGGQFTEPLHYGKEVADEGGQIKTLLSRFFPAYFSGSTADLAYYLTPEARIQAFQSPWSFDSVTEVILSQTEGGLYALSRVVLADPATGARYTNRYTLGLVRREGRWYIHNILQKGE